jgi:hypothetical protein
MAAFFCAKEAATLFTSTARRERVPPCRVIERSTSISRGRFAEISKYPRLESCAPDSHGHVHRLLCQWLSPPSGGDDSARPECAGQRWRGTVARATTRRLSWAPLHLVGQGRSRPELRFDPAADGFSLSLRPCGHPVSALMSSSRSSAYSGVLQGPAPADIWGCRTTC